MTGNDGGSFDRGRYIAHSIISGTLAKVLSSVTDVGNPDEAYISGIMHDVGGHNNLPVFQ